MIKSSTKLDILTILGRQLSHLVAKGNTLDEALDLLRKASDESLTGDIDRLQQLLSGKNEEMTLGPFSQSPIVAIGHLIGLAEKLGGHPVKLLAELETTLSSLTEGYRAYWVGIGGFLLYATILFVVTIFALLIFTIFVLPQFSEVYSNLGTDLPVLTQVVMNTLQVIQWPLLFAGTGIIVALSIVTHKLRDNMKRLSPLRGAIVKFPGLRRLCRSYNESLTLNFARLLHSTGVSADTALSEAARITDTDITKSKSGKDSDSLVTTLERGDLAAALSFAKKLNVLEQELDYLTAETEARHTERLIEVREEFTLIAQIFIAVVITILLLSMYLPIFKLGSVI